MKQVMMVKFDSPKWRKVDEYKVANPFVDVGFRQVKDVVDLRVFDLLNISRINGYLDRYAKDSDITEVWVWYEQTSGNSYEVYIGYA